MPRQQMPPTCANERLARGYSIIELMVAMTVGLLILAALATIFANNSRTRTEIERAHQQTENGRYALQLLTDDLHNAGYFAEFNPGTVANPNPALTVPTAIPDPCATSLATITTNIAVPVQGYYNVQAGSIPSCLSDVKTGTDILVIRRASTCAVGDANCDPQIAGAPYFQAAACGTQLQANNAIALDTNTANLNSLQKRDCATQAPLHQYRTHIYYIAKNDKAGDGIPTLKRADLGPGLNFNTVVPLVEGIENLHIEYGLDTGAQTTGSPAVYTADPNTYNGCAPAACVNYWRNTVSAKINLLARNTTATPGFTDNKSYTLGRKFDGSLNTIPAPGDGFRRHVYESVVRLNNLAGRNTP